MLLMRAVTNKVSWKQCAFQESGSYTISVAQQAEEAVPDVIVTIWTPSGSAVYSILSKTGDIAWRNSEKRFVDGWISDLGFYVAARDSSDDMISDINPKTGELTGESVYARQLFEVALDVDLDLQFVVQISSDKIKSWDVREWRDFPNCVSPFKSVQEMVISNYQEVLVVGNKQSYFGSFNLAKCMTNFENTTAQTWNVITSQGYYYAVKNSSNSNWVEYGDATTGALSTFPISDGPFGKFASADVPNSFIAISYDDATVDAYYRGVRVATVESVDQGIHTACSPQQCFLVTQHHKHSPSVTYFDQNNPQVMTVKNVVELEDN